MTPRRIVILGSTGSIGTQGLEVVRNAPGRFIVDAVCAGGSNLPALAAQAAEFEVAAVGVGRADAADQLQAELDKVWPAGVRPPVLLAGPDAAEELAGRPVDVVLNGVDGMRGLRSTLAALSAGTVVALANKESLVAGGRLVLDAAAPGQLVPVDSEHSALAQCLRSGSAAEVARLVLTASGGPFRGHKRADLVDVTPERAMAHPTWTMGGLVTMNSATLVNKGLELIEAHLLFGIPYDRIDVVVHPQSIVHSMVTFTDGATIAQASPPDMRLPIGLGLGWPDRVPGSAKTLDWSTASQWTFEPLDEETFPAVSLARRAGEAGGCAGAVFNAANEQSVTRFLAGRTGFLGIVSTIGAVLDDWLALWHDEVGEPSTVEDVESAERWARQRVDSLLGTTDSD